MKNFKTIFSAFLFVMGIGFLTSCSDSDKDKGNSLKDGEIEMKVAISEDNTASFIATAKEITIDWGDGIVEELNVNGSKKTFTHEYVTKSSEKTIKVESEKLTYFETESDNYAEIIFGDSPELLELSCNENPNLTKLEIKKAEKLETLNCYDNKLTSLDLANCTSLSYLNCVGNDFKPKAVKINERQKFDYILPALNSGIYAVEEENGTESTLKEGEILIKALPIFDKYSKKTVISIKASAKKISINWGDGITEEFSNIGNGDEGEDISHEYKNNDERIIKIESNELIYFNLYDGDMKNIEFGECKYLKILYCSESSITTLDVSNCKSLVELSCYQNKLTSLDVSRNIKLKRLDCEDNKVLSSLNISNCTELEEVLCEENQLTTLDLSSCISLESLTCYKNKLTSLDLSKNTKLEYIDCHDNKLTSLDVSKNPELWYLSCSNNQLKSLDLTKNPEMEELYCDDNNFTPKSVKIKDDNYIRRMSPSKDSNIYDWIK